MASRRGPLRADRAAQDAAAPPIVEEAFPVISTPDLGRAVGFYADLLGGTVTYRFPAEGRPAYLTVQLGSSKVGLADAPGVDTSTRQRLSLWLSVRDCDEAIERVRAAGWPVVEEPKDQPWGERVARVADPDGNAVVIGQRASSGR